MNHTYLTEIACWHMLQFCIHSPNPEPDHQECVKKCVDNTRVFDADLRLGQRQPRQDAMCS